MEERLKEFEELSAKWGYGSEAEHQHQNQQQQQQQDESASSANAQENNELNPMATKYGWGESEGGAVFNELPWQDQQQQQQQQQMFDENHFMSNDNKDSENYQWQTHDPSDFLNGTGETPESGFHLSSDGSTWDKTAANTRPPGLDWNQYESEVSGEATDGAAHWNEMRDEEMSGQPSLFFLEGQQQGWTDGSGVGGDVDVPGANCTQDYPRDGRSQDAHQMWASEENSVTFPPVSMTECDASQPIAEEVQTPMQQQQQDETDLCSPAHGEQQAFETVSGEAGTPEVGLSPQAAVAPLPEETRLEATAVAAIEVEGESQSVTQPDFHWNLHAPEFEFRPNQSSSSPPPPPPPQLVVEEPVVAAAQHVDVVETEPAQEMAVSNGHGQEEVVVEAAAAATAHDSMMVGAESCELLQPVERKLSATELLVKSSSDAELAVLLAAANDDPEEMEPAADDDNEILSPRSAYLDDQQERDLANESKDDGAVEADSSEDEGDDWTFYRKGQDNKEESEMEATEVSILKSPLPETGNAGDEPCVSDTCEANELGDQLERLAVAVDETAVTAANQDQDDTTISSENDVVEVPAVSSSVVETEIVPLAEPTPELAEVQCSEGDKTVTEVVVETVIESVVGPVVEQETEKIPDVESKSELDQVFPLPLQVRELSSPVSDTGATIGSDAGLVTTAVPNAAAKAAGVKNTAKKPAATAAVKKTSLTTAKPAPANQKEPAKKMEPTTRRVPAADSASKAAEVKPSRPTKLSPLRKASPAAATSPKPAPPKSAASASTTASPRPPISRPATAKSTASASAPAKPTTAATKTTTTIATTVKKTTTTTRPAIPSTVKKTSVPSAAAASTDSAASVSKTTVSARSTVSASTRTAAPRTAGAPPVTSAAAAATRKVAPTPVKVPSATSRPATNPAPKPAVNGDVKAKPSVTARAAAKPTATANGMTNGTGPVKNATASRPAPVSVTASRAAPLKSVAAKSTAASATPKKTTTTAARPVAKSPATATATTATAAVANESSSVATDN